MIKTRALWCLTLWLTCASSQAAQAEDEIATYAVPADAVKVESPIRQPHDLNGDHRTVEYYAAGQKTIPENLIGREGLYQGKRLSFQLFKARQLHGVQRTWDTNGQLTSEESYRDGVRHGIFRKWDHAGWLISQATLKEGSGTIRVYTLQGELRSENSFKDNQPHGWSLSATRDYYSPGFRTFSWFSNGKAEGAHYDFYLDGRPRSILLWSPSGHDNCSIFFREDGTPSRSWMLAGKAASEGEYAKAVQTDPLLPAYFPEATRYLEAIPKDVLVAERTRREMLPVKIPLSFDSHGEPIPITAEDKRKEAMEYALPADVNKVGPMTMKGDHETAINYLLDRGAEYAVLASERYQNEVLLERHLYLPTWRPHDSWDVTHGIQREWHANGQLKSESPWWRGRMEGTFRHWDEQGRLIGQYEMHDGNGIRRVYSADGRLQLEEPLTDSNLNGIAMSVQKIGLRNLMSFRRGKQSGPNYRFHPGGELSLLYFNYTGDESYAMSALHGPGITFDPKGTVTEKHWYVHGREVEEAAYATAATQESTLPPYYSDPKRYQEYVGKNIRDMEASYRNAPRVRIPLEFDEQNHPLLEP